MDTDALQLRIARAQERTYYTIGKRQFKRIAYGSERGFSNKQPIQCRDCGVAVGQLHTAFCCREDCPSCFGQLLSCGCVPREVSAEAKANEDASH